MTDVVDLTYELSFAIRAIFLSSTRVKALQTNIQFFSSNFLYPFRDLVPPGQASNFVKVNVVLVT